MRDASSPLSAAADALTALLGDRFSQGGSVRDLHSRGEAYHPPRRPDGVAFPTSTAEVSDIMRICAAHRVPVTPFAIGSSLEGHVTPVQGGLSLDLSRMDRVIAVNAEDLDAVAEPGVTRTALNNAVRPHGLIFTVDPGAEASLGGMAATRASGTNTVRYGTMRDAVLALEVVLADGRVIRTGGRARKSAAGYDLTRLFVGSEGTLGVITELTVRLFGAPEAISAATCPFESVDGAVATVIEATQYGLPLARIELLDALFVRAVNRHMTLDLPETPHLFLEFHGSADSVAEQTRRFGEIAREHGGGDYAWANKEEDRNRLWRARHSAYFAAQTLRPGARSYVTDVCVPISRLAEAIRETQRDLAASRLPAPIVGHVGDGNFHVQILIDPTDPAELAEARSLGDRMARRALELDGTVTGEHGVGLGKKQLLVEEHGDALAVMAAVKTALDPYNLMNPGKIFDLTKGRPAP